MRLSPRVVLCSLVATALATACAHLPRSGGLETLKPAVETFRPFCSGRCKDVDLHRWFSGAYAIPAEESAEDSAQERDVNEKEGR